VLKHYGDFIVGRSRVGEMPVQVTLSPRLAWQLKLQNGMLVDIGREQPKSPVGVRLASALSRSIRKWSPNGRSGRQWWICGIRMVSRCESRARGRESKHMSRDNKDLIVGLDIGTSKIVALVAEINNEGASTSSAWARRIRAA
jgi:hypothetical protein